MPSNPFPSTHCSMHPHCFLFPTTTPAYLWLEPTHLPVLSLVGIFLVCLVCVLCDPWNSTITLYSNSLFSILAYTLPKVRCFVLFRTVFPGLTNYLAQNRHATFSSFSYFLSPPHFFFLKEAGLGKKERVKEEEVLEENKQGHIWTPTLLLIGSN